ncbi:type I toxin-antitoxin system Fst family toxin [Enterococcus sp. 669A]|uniref:Type I toxin-antitoxin system Fst family toxin n=1 Tax=Candidatus Enterococcus moelleringii TaxID=2815325 RepID=A0ABS3LBK2_9ENTE|nr:type I toxin-antitoxin system Fst family toxin [Enterococcus sp. 669A]
MQYIVASIIVGLVTAWFKHWLALTSDLSANCTGLTVEQIKELQNS